MFCTYNGYYYDDDGELEVLHTHGSGKVPACSFECDRLEESKTTLLSP